MPTPQNFGTNGGGSSALAAFTNGWQSWSRYPPVYWDTDIHKFIVYGNFYHNTGDWPLGWQTQVTITNNYGSGMAVSYTLENHLGGGRHGHPNPELICGDPNSFTYNENVIGLPSVPPYDRPTELEQPLLECPPGGANSDCRRTFDAFRFHVHDDVLAGHDTVLFIEPNSASAGATTTVLAYVHPNSSGNSLGLAPGEAPTNLTATGGLRLFRVTAACEYEFQPGIHR